MSDGALSLRRPPEPLTDGVVMLDAFTGADVRDVVDAIDDEILRWLGLPDPYGESDARAFIEGPPNVAVEGPALNFAIRRTGGAGVAGSIRASVSGPASRQVSVGYWVAPHVRRQGVAVRAVRLLAGYVLATGDVARVEILTHAANTGSRRVAERAGAVFEGIRPGGHRRTRFGTSDAAVYALLPTAVLG